MNYPELIWRLVEMLLQANIEKNNNDSKLNDQKQDEA